MKWLNGSKIKQMLIGLVVSLAVASFAQARIITVGPGVAYDFDTIQVGIDAAVDGDVVLVAPGEYVITEPITFRGKAITVMSETGPDETTIRMGEPTDTERGSVVVFENNETNASVLDGFTISGGTGCWRWIPEYSEFKRCGGGILFDASSTTVRNCSIMQNRVGNGGGGVAVLFGASVTLTNCIIRDNSSSEAGGGVLCWKDSSITITDCAIMNNTAQRAGGGIYCGHGSATVTNCVITRNTGLLWGGGGVMSSYANASLAINNCTIWGNSGGSLWGGGGVLCRQASATVTNSIIWGNTSPVGREISVQDAASKLTITYSNVGGGQAGVSVESGCTLSWGAGNIDVHPCFADRGYWADIYDPNIIVQPDDPNAVWIDGDYHLKSEAGRWDPYSESWVLDDVTSPCIDRGDPNSPVGDEPDPNGGLVNMGAYGGTPAASMSIGQLPPLPPLAYWKLDETEGDIAYDSVAVNDAVVFGDVVWQPDSGQVNGALQLDGIDDYVSTPFVLNPADGKFSVFVWIKGGAPGQVVISQAGGANWLLADPSGGKLQTSLLRPAGGRIVPQPLISEFIITDGNWHRIGFVWDGTSRILYVDDIEVARDTQAQASLEAAYGGLYFGAGSTLEPGSFFSGLIDDVRIYDRAVLP